MPLLLLLLLLPLGAAESGSNEIAYLGSNWHERMGGKRLKVGAKVGAKVGVKVGVGDNVGDNVGDKGGDEMTAGGVNSISKS